MWSVAPDETLRRSIALFLTTIFGVYLAERYDSYTFLRMLMWVLIACIVLSLVFIFAVPHLGIMQHNPHVGAWRGVFVHKNVLGRYMVVAIVVFAVLATWKAWEGEKPIRWLWFFVALALFLLLMSQSRSPLAAGAVVLLGLPLANVLRLKPLMSLAGVTIALALVIVIGAAAWLNFELLLGGLGRDATLTGRTTIWELVLDKIHERPMLGYGYSAFWADPNGPVSDVWAVSRWNATHAHSGLLEVWLGVGLVGLTLFALGFISTIAAALRDIRSEGGGESLWILVFLSLFLAISVTESSILGRNTLFWIMYVYCMCRVSARRKRPFLGTFVRLQSGDQALAPTRS